MVNYIQPKQYYVYYSINDTLSLTTHDIDNDKSYKYTYEIFNNILYRISNEKKGYLKIKNN